MMGMMSQMMGSAQQAESPMMPNMMTQMMPHCLNMMLPNIPKEERVEFVLDMVAKLIEQGSVGMTDEEKDEFMAKILEKITSCDIKLTKATVSFSSCSSNRSSNTNLLYMFLCLQL
jgi:predicted GTPase